MKHFALLPHTQAFSLLFRLSLLLSVLLLAPPAAHAGCGCTKPAPAPAAVRPNVTYSGQPVTVFHSNLVTGGSYTVTFTSMSGESITVSAQAVALRDIADGQVKTQLLVIVPPLPLGPTGISVRLANENGVLTAIPDVDFTIAPQPITIPAQLGDYHFKNFQAAVSRQGVFYLSLDLSNVTDAEIFQARMIGYPLRLSTDTAVFYNTQGYLMQMLNQGIPGLSSVESVDKAKESDILQYARHEFNSYFLAHQERQAHAVDATDPNWHADGTRHVDHNHLILALTGQLGGGALPEPGMTRKFELRLTTASLFSVGLLGRDSVDISGAVVTKGDVLSNGAITISDSTVVNGDVTGASVTLRGKGHVKSRGHNNLPGDLLPVYIPQLATDLGSISLTGDQTLTLEPGTYNLSGLILRGNSQLLINNVQEAVTLYVTGNVEVSDAASIRTTATGPEDFSLYVQGNNNVTLVSNGAFYGLIYAPESLLALSGTGDFYGAFVGRAIRVTGDVTVNYDTTSEVVKAKKAKKAKV
jgi:hypothetical protein